MATARDNEAEDRRRKGNALRALRIAMGHTQDSAASNLNVTAQAWQNYEHGRRHLSDEKMGDLLRAIGATREEFELELARHADATRRPLARRAAVADRAVSFRIPFGGIAHGGGLRPLVSDEDRDHGEDLGRFFAPGTEIVRLSGMSMYPYADDGGFVTFNRREPARRNHGCVIILKNGVRLIKRFDYFDDRNLYVTELWPEEKQLTFPLQDVEGVYAIGLRGD